MTPKQTERIQKKILKIRRALADERRMFGGYHDGRGLRYMPPRLYIDIQDYKGGIIYLRWFKKNFPDDIGFPDFLFEWTIILYRSGKIKDAEKKAFETFCGNIYLFDKYFDRPIIPLDIYEWSNLAGVEFVNQFDYSASQLALADFTHWLDSLIRSDDFVTRADKYIDIYKQLKTEHNTKKRHLLGEEARQLMGR